MKKLQAILPTDPILNQLSVEVSPEELASPEIQALIDHMFEQAAGKGHSKKDSRQMVGLAAVQLGVPKCLIFIDLTANGAKQEQNLLVIANPRITTVSEETVLGREGCWSCGSICGAVERAQSVTLEGLDRDGKPLKLSLEGFVARIAQHEVDHLTGIRFPDRIPVDKPEHLHWVNPEEFEAYRTEWEHWEQLCPRSRWEAMKAGKS